MEFSHIDKQGKARMVDVSGKDVTVREAVAKGNVIVARNTLTSILETSNPKGDVLATARIAGIMAAKKTSDIIPLCHNIPLDSVKIEFGTHFDDIKDCGIIEITATAKATWKTGVEMEAINGVLSSALVIYDMCKAVDKDIVISDVRLIRKTGGKSREFVRSEKDGGKSENM